MDEEVSIVKKNIFISAHCKVDNHDVVLHELYLNS